MNNVVESVRSRAGSNKVLTVVAVSVLGIVGLALLMTLGPPVAAVLGIAVAIVFGLALLALPFAVLGFAIYGVMQLAGHRRGGSDPAPARMDPGPYGVAAPVPGMPPAPTPTRTDLPPELSTRVARITDKARVLQTPKRDALLSIDDRRRVQDTVNEFLPHLLSLYRSLPNEHREWAEAEAGRSARQELEEQLDLLEKNLDQIASHAFEAGVSQLMMQRQFLREALQPETGELTVIPKDATQS
ncbi:MAG TPA: hypothetical protein VIA06_20650 [Candidatus Dormibacteraeota bacterium]|jgi:hypothetical protein|nr:hypothetical protein [Candidatus Dormibacteraeota bacterium]